MQHSRHASATEPVTQEDHAGAPRRRFVIVYYILVSKEIQAGSHARAPVSTGSMFAHARPELNLCGAQILMLVR